jgi:hypothetical protein
LAWLTAARPVRDLPSGDRIPFIHPGCLWQFLIEEIVRRWDAEEGAVDFRWNEWNTEHVAEHGVEREAAEHDVEGAKAPYPRRIGEDKLLVWGPGPASCCR